MGAAFTTVVAVSSWIDEHHSAWRDPVSYFGSPEAPWPTLFAVTLAGLGGAIVWSGRRSPLRYARVGLITIGVCSILLAALPVDCSPVDDACEVVVRAGADSASHDLHGYIGFVLHLAVAVTAGFAASSRPFGIGRLGTTAALVVGLAGLAPVILVLVRPFDAGLGIAQVVGFGAAGMLVVADLASS